MPDIDNSGRAILEGGDIIIRVARVALPGIVVGAWAASGMDVRLKVTNVDEFAKELVNELNREAEDGTTRIHRMFDGAINETIEQGAGSPI